MNREIKRKFAKLLKKVKLLVPQSPNKPTRIIGGEASGILNWNDLLYGQWYEIYRKLLAQFWTPFELSMGDDMKQWQQLSEAERQAFLRIIALLAILDSVQPNYLSKVKDYISDSAVKALITIIEQQEVVHNHSYSYVLASVEKESVQNRAFEMARTEEKIYKRNTLIIDLYEELDENPSLEVLCKSLLASIVLEGINFYSGFAFFYNLARNQKMLKTSTMISYINRDEMTHAYFITVLFKLILEENPEVNANGELNEFANDLFRQAVDMEIEWSEYVLSEIEDIDMREMSDYIKYRANKCLNMIGFDSIYEGVSENSMPWIRVFTDENTNQGKTDFFEQKSRQYAKVTDENGFDDL